MNWADACYRALQTRDARFDGHFFTAVRTTGIYCRPVCPAPTPKVENCLFFRHAAGAQEAGFRPCLRCRPELSPGVPAAAGTSATIVRGMRLIGEGALDDCTVDALATRLGVGERHLRRLFLEHVGASPLAVAQTRRTLFAKKLIDETSLSMSDIAIAAGFGSVRRFNDAFALTYGRSPREMRKAQTRRTDEHSAITLKLPFRPPYDWKALTGFYGPRAIAGVEAVSDNCYRRTIRLDGVDGYFEVRHATGENWLSARIAIPSLPALSRVSARLRRMFDVEADSEAIARQLQRDRKLRPVIRKLPGLRIPGAWDPFELAVRAILGQQVSVRAATTLAGRIAERYGTPFSPVEGLRFVFPEPQVLAAADLTSVGLVKARARAVSGLADAVASKRLCFEALEGLDDVVRALCELPGIGPWTAHYVAMRAYGEPDAFPETDLGLCKAVSASAKELAKMAEAWRPWRAYAAMSLWMSGSGG